MDSKPLIIYYSKTGTTAKIVDIVLPRVKAEGRRLSEPNGWREKLDLRGIRRNGADKVDLVIVDGYDPIILLTPVWDGKPASSMFDLLERIDLRGKRVLLGLVGANKTNPDALEKLRRKAIERGSIFIESIFIKGVTPGRDWTELGEEDYRREAERLVNKIASLYEFTR